MKNDATKNTAERDASVVADLERHSDENVQDWARDRLFGPGTDSYNRPMAIADAMEAAEGDPERVWTLFNVGWPMCDSIPRFILDDIVVMLGRQPNYGVDYLDELSRTFYDRLPEKVTIYRGARPAQRLGLSWTTELDIARNFALYHRGYPVPGGLIFQSEVDKASIWSVSVDREENLIVINPTLVARTAQMRP